MKSYIFNLGCVKVGRNGSESPEGSKDFVNSKVVDDLEFQRDNLKTIHYFKNLRIYNATG